MYVVLWTVLVLAIFGYFLSLLERKTKSIKFWTKFWIKQLNFLSSKCTSLRLLSKPVQRNWVRFFKNLKKTVRALMVNEIKVASRNAFIDNLFALENKKE